MIQSFAATRPRSGLRHMPSCSHISSARHPAKPCVSKSYHTKVLRTQVVQKSLRTLRTPPSEKPTISRRLCIQNGQMSKTDDEIRKEVTKRIIKFGRTNNPHEAVQALVDMGLKGVQPDIKAATATLAACVSCGQIQLAAKVYDEIFLQRVVKPDLLVFETLLRGYMACTPPQWGKSEALVAEMERVFGLQPSAATFNTLLEGCVRSNDTEMGNKLLDRMVAKDVYPDSKTYEVIKRKKILRAYFKKTFQ